MTLISLIILNLIFIWIGYRAKKYFKMHLSEDEAYQQLPPAVQNRLAQIYDMVFNMMMGVFAAMAYMSLLALLFNLGESLQSIK